MGFNDLNGINRLICISKRLIPRRWVRARDDSTRPHRRWIYSVLGCIFLTFGSAFFLFDSKSFDEHMIRHGAILICLILVFLVVLVILISRYFAHLWAQRKGQQAGARLHARLVTIFGMSAALPTLLMIVFAVFSFRNGIQAWFTSKNQSVLRQSMAVAQGYLTEQNNVVRADAELIAQALNPYLLTLEYAPHIIQDKLENLLQARSLDEGMILDQNLHVMACSRLTLTLQFETLSSHDLREAELYPVVMISERGDRLRALVALPTDPVRYLYVGKFVDPQILGYIEKTHGAVAEYQALEHHQGKISLFFALVMVVVGILVVLCCVGLALVIADQMIQPISHLIAASERIRTGDLTVRVPVGVRSYELSLLSRTFNRMVRQMAWQQNALIDTNQVLEARKNLLQTVLAGVRSGVIGLDHQGLIQWPNQTASEILHIDLNQHLQEKLGNVIPDFEPLFKTLHPRTLPYVQGEVNRVSAHKASILLVRIAVHATPEGAVEGYVVTFDDMTNILEAQRQATWSEAAKRVAHEIKNPLTPIRLAADRLRKKLTFQEAKEEELLRQCTSTIMRQVDTIGRLIDRFSTLAHMPASTMQDVQVDVIVQDAVALHKIAHHDIDMHVVVSGQVRAIPMDVTSMTQVLNNILLNAIQSIHARQSKNPLPRGYIKLLLDYSEDFLMLRIEDNGEGLPVGLADRLTEPYITTKIGGTGLGLSIVKKIMSEHGGSLSLINRTSGGVCVTLSFPDASMRNPSSAH